VQAAVVHQRHAMTALGLVQVRRGEQDRHALGRQLGQRVPELAPRDGIDAGGRLVEQEDARLGHEGAGQGELLLHAAAQPAGQAPGEALQAKHGQVALPSRLDVAHGDTPQLTHVAKVLGHAEVLVQAERLREVADVRARVPRRPAEQLRLARRRLHHATQDLERRRLAGAVGPDESEDLPGADLEIDAAHRRDRAVALDEPARADGDGRIGHRRACRVGQLLPSTRISPSAGIPGLANPTAPRSCSFTPTTCFTRSSRK
jgi:hypothetical protein